jgi:hypothetical protein
LVEVTVAVIAQELDVNDDGTFDILGVLTGLRVSAVPYEEPYMTLFLSFSASPAEVGRERRVEVHLLDADGSLMRKSWTTVTVPEPPHPGRRADLNVVFPLRNVPFVNDGDHSFHIFVGDDEKRVVPFHIDVENGEE